MLESTPLLSLERRHELVRVLVELAVLRARRRRIQNALRHNVLVTGIREHPDGVVHDNVPTTDCNEE